MNRYHINKQTFEYLFRKYYKALCFFANQFIMDKDECKDLVQDVFIALWNIADNFNEEKLVKYYLYNSVRNKCLNLIRHEKVKSKYLNDLQYPTVDEGIIESGVFDTIYKALNELTPQECNVMMGVLHGHSNQEIADDMGISINTVKTLRQRSYKSLREKLKGLQWLLVILFG